MFGNDDCTAVKSPYYKSIDGIIRTEITICCDSTVFQIRWECDGVLEGFTA